ncbi:hypothetical protein [Deinococcus carri]|uniref:hypothetical protein n=1 Tax=Deinococcus carri TaxID=1211323 RepID=UPI0031E9D07A
MTLQHRQQHGQVGCLYHSLYALLGDEALLEHANDVSAPRYYARLAAAGMLVSSLWCTEPGFSSTPTAFWESLRRRFTAASPGGAAHAPLLVNIGGATPGWLHQVAVLLPISPGEDIVHVSDSNFHEPLQFTWDGFLHSDYAQAYRVEMLGPADLDAYA